VTTAVAVLLALGGIMKLGSVVSPVRLQGPAGLACIGFGVIGSLLSVVEWQTRGRYRLGPLALAFAAMTILSAIGGVASGASRIFGGLAQLDDQASYGALMANGLYEVLGQLATGALLTGFQLLLWAAAKRRVSATT
jgi:hypothetical protein